MARVTRPPEKQPGVLQHLDLDPILRYKHRASLLSGMNILSYQLAAGCHRDNLTPYPAVEASRLGAGRMF
jgi:hypothetical protein